MKKEEQHLNVLGPCGVYAVGANMQSCTDVRSEISTKMPGSYLFPIAQNCNKQAWLSCVGSVGVRAGSKLEKRVVFGLSRAFRGSSVSLFCV